MKNYLSIGDVSKMKGVSAKSLRYYGLLGILPPAYINPDTGYRYYTINQMIILDLITMCIDLDIPLREFKNYILPNQILDMEKIQRDGESIVKDKIKKLKKNLYQLEKMSEHLNETKAILHQKKEQIRHIEQRYFITIPYYGNYNDISYFWERITELNKSVKQHDLTTLANQGICFLYQHKELRAMAFMQVAHSPKKGIDLRIIPEGEFHCATFLDEELDTIQQKYFDDTTYEEGTILIMRELFDKKLESKPMPVEMQCSLQIQ